MPTVHKTKHLLPLFAYPLTLFGCPNPNISDILRALENATPLPWRTRIYNCVYGNSARIWSPSNTVTHLTSLNFRNSLHRVDWNGELQLAIFKITFRTQPTGRTSAAVCIYFTRKRIFCPCLSFIREINANFLLALLKHSPSSLHCCWPPRRNDLAITVTCDVLTRHSSTPLLGHPF